MISFALVLAIIMTAIVVLKWDTFFPPKAELKTPTELEAPISEKNMT